MKKTPLEKFAGTHRSYCTVHIYSGDRHCSCGRDELVKEFERLQGIARKIMDSEFTFFYPVIIEEQLDFEGRAHQKEVFLEGHIIHGGRLMCGESMEVVKNRCGTKKAKVASKRVERAKLCEECARRYKKNGHSAYTAWVEGKPLTPAVKMPPLAKF